MAFGPTFNIAPGFNIVIDMDRLIRIQDAFGADEFPHLQVAVDAITDQCEALWKAFAAGAPMPNGKIIQSRSGQYGRSITQRRRFPFSNEVFSLIPYAKVIEEGAPARDMKEILRTSLKVRVSKAGKRYLIIPFRHDTGKAMSGGNPMPAAILAWWKGKRNAASSTISEHERVSGTGVSDIKTRQPLTVPAWKYHWGKRLSKSALEGMGLDAQAARRYQGMVNFRIPGKKGGAAHSKYLTFRTMSEGSKGWIAPAREGKWPAKQVGDVFRPVAEDVFRSAMQQDVAAKIQGATIT